MSAVTVKIGNLNKVIELAQKYPKVAEKHIGTAITRALVRIWGEEKRQAPFGVSGNLRDNWRLFTGRFFGSLTSGAPYSATVHDGGEPRYVSPVSLKAWAEKRGLNPYTVSNSIKKNGTKANPFFQRAVDNTEKGVDGEFEKALESIVQEIKW